MSTYNHERIEGRRLVFGVGVLWMGVRPVGYAAAAAQRRRRDEVAAATPETFAQAPPDGHGDDGASAAENHLLTRLHVSTLQRREREKVALRQKILDTAREILATEGPGALTMRRLAHRIEYTPGALYAHFADKDALLRELCRCDFYEFAGQLQGALATEDPMDRLRSLARHYARFGLEHPQQYRIMFMMDPVPELSKLKEDRGDPARDGYALLEFAIAYAVERGCFPQWKDEQQLLAQTLWCGMHGVIAIEIVKGNPGDRPMVLEPFLRRVEAMCEALLAGLRDNGPPPR
jgi:AcrR family transcriptional regulator